MNGLFDVLINDIKYNRNIEIKNNVPYIKEITYIIDNPKRAWVLLSPESVIKDSIYLYSHICGTNHIYNRYFDDHISIHQFSNIINLLNTIDEYHDIRFFYDVYKNNFITIEITDMDANLYYHSIFETMESLRKNVFLCSKILELVSKYCKVPLGKVFVNSFHIDISAFDSINDHIDSDFNIKSSFKFASLTRKDVSLFSMIEKGLYATHKDELIIKYKTFLDSKNIFSSKNLNYLISSIFYANCKIKNCFDEDAKDVFLENTYPELRKYFLKHL